MKRLLLAGVAAVAFAAPGTGLRAADMAVQAPPAPAYVPPPAYNWTGFYVGANVGGGAATAPIFDTLTGVNVGSVSELAFIGGGQIGYNYQFSPNFILGVEWFFDGIAGNNDNSITFIAPASGNFFQASAKADWVTTITGRFGYTSPVVPWFIYTKTGWGWVQTQSTFTDLTVPASFTTTKTNGGWVSGAGIEWAFAPNWSAKLEYQYIALNSIGVANGVVLDQFNVDKPNIQMVTLGINYLFNWSPPSPVVTRY
jgi:outer membrane immunogenic protein